MSRPAIILGSIPRRSTVRIVGLDDDVCRLWAGVIQRARDDIAYLDARKGVPWLELTRNERKRVKARTDGVVDPWEFLESIGLQP